jgi:hypothetical protein
MGFYKGQSNGADPMAATNAVPTRALYFTQQELELISFAIDTMANEENLDMLKMTLSQYDLDGFNALLERVRRW